MHARSGRQAVISGQVETRVERVRELERFALRRLPALQLGDGVFCEEVPADEPRPQGRSLRNTVVVLLGLLRAEEHGLEPSFHLGALRSRVLSELQSTELAAADLGLALWAESRTGGDAAGELIAGIRQRLGRLDALPSIEVAWITTGLTEAGARGSLGEGEEVLAECRAQLLKKRRPRAGLVARALRGRGKRLPQFGDQIFSVQALSQLARIRDDDAAREGARQIGDLLLECRMPNGGWPALYDAGRGRAVEPYELASVNQDATAMIGMHGLSEASGEPRYREAAVRGVDWVFGANELGAPMFDPEAGMLYRSIRRRQRFVRAQARSAAFLRAAPRPAKPEELEVDRSMRPDHLGWLLEAWSGREHLAGTVE